MAVLPTSGTISLGDVRSSLGLTGAISLNDATVRAISPAGSASSATAISLSSVYSYGYNPTIAANVTNYNMKSAAIAAGWDQRRQLNMSVTINSGIYVYSTSTGAYAFQTGSTFPTGSYLGLTNNGVIRGKGGDGGAGGASVTASQYLVKGTLSANQNLNNGSDTVINFDTKAFDPQNWFNTTSHTVTPTIAGYYKVTFSAWFTQGTGSAGTQYNIQIHYQKQADYHLFHNKQDQILHIHL